MAIRYVRSAFWLCAFTGMGYGLLVLCTPSDADIKELRKTLPGVEKDPSQVNNKNQQFINVLQLATQNNKPLYRLSKEELDKELKKP